MKKLLLTLALTLLSLASFAQQDSTTVYDLKKISKNIYKDYHEKLKHTVDSVVYHHGVDSLQCIVFDNIRIGADGTVEHEVKANTEDERLNRRIEKHLAKVRFPALHLLEAGETVPIGVTASFIIVANVSTEWVEYDVEIKAGSGSWEEGIDRTTLTYLNNFAKIAFCHQDSGKYRLRMSKYLVNGDLKLYDVVEIYKVRKKGDDLIVRYAGSLFSGFDPYKDMSPRSKESETKFDDNVVRPLFGGSAADGFSLWVNRKLVYPPYCKDRYIQGDVVFRFTVGKEGDVEDIRVIEPKHPLLDRESYRVISQSPKWTPGTIDGKPVRVSYTFPTYYRLR